jgi:capsular exopolysaccharide synthesis family protein
MNRKQLADQSGGNALTRYDPSFEYTAGGDAEESAPNVFAAIWRWRWAVLSITILFVIGAVIFLRFMPPSYTSTALLTISAPQNPMNTPGALPTDTGDVFQHQQLAIMDSPVVTDTAAKALRPYATADELHDFSNKLRDKLMTDVGKTDNVVSVSYTDKTGDDAANNVNAILNAYIDYVTKTHGDSSQQLIDVLKNEEMAAQAKLDTIRNKIIDFRTQHPEMSFTDQKGVNVADSDVVNLYAARNQAKIAHATAQAQYNTADGLMAVNDVAQLEEYAAKLAFRPPDLTEAIANTRKNIETAEGQLSLYKGNYPDGNPTVMRLKAFVAEQTAALQIQTAKFADEFLQNLKRTVTETDEQVKAIEDEIKDSEDKASNVNKLDGELQRLLNDRDGEQKEIDQIDATIKEENLSNVIGRLPNIRVLQQARGGDDAVRTPDPTRVLILTLGAGLAFGIGFALLREKLDQRVRSAEEIASLLGLPVVGVVPHMKSGLTALAKAQAVHWDPMSEVSEAYRAVRTAVHFGVQAGQARTIVVTSPTPGDGKSTLASNLAISFAQAGKRTLLLDADFRRPVQHRMFEMKDTDSGLTAVLAGHEPLSKAIRRTVVEGLDILPAGPLPLNPSELLNGESFAGIIEELSQKYDHIVLDCPPVIAVTDARILGAVCDLSLLVLRAGKTTRQGAELARSGLLSVGSRLLGVVVNDVPRGDEHYGYYGSYAYHGGGTDRIRLTDESNGASNGHSKSRRRLPSPSGVDSMQ